MSTIVPYPRQREFLRCDAYEVLYGGAAGGGKSFALQLDALQHIRHSRFRGVLFRSNLTDLTEIIDESKRLFPKADPAAVYREVEKTWVFSTGARLEFKFLECDEDRWKYQGRQWQWMGFDELTLFRISPSTYTFMKSRVRCPEGFMRTYVRCTTNPIGPGAVWVKKYFVDPAPPNTLILDPTTGFFRMFMPAKLEDNLSLSADGVYRRNLMALPEHTREALLEGRWDCYEGAVFSEWDHKIHTCDPFPITRDWNVYRSGDYGRRADSAIGWWAQDKDDNLVLIKELVVAGLDADRMARAILDCEHELADHMPWLRPTGGRSRLDGPLDTACWNKTGTGLSVADIMWENGVRWFKANKDRIQGVFEFHRRLNLMRKDVCSLRFFKTCPRHIESIPALVHKTSSQGAKEEDVDSRSDDHCYDSARYMLMYLRLRDSGVLAKRHEEERQADMILPMPFEHNSYRDPVTGY